MTHKHLSVVAVALIIISVAATAVDASRAVARVQSDMSVLEADDAITKQNEMALLNKTYAETTRITLDVARVNATLDQLTDRLQTLEKRVDK